MTKTERDARTLFVQRDRLPLDVAVCALPGCGVVWEKQRGPGRPRKYCTTEHSKTAYELREKAIRHLRRSRPGQQLLV